MPVLLMPAGNDDDKIKPDGEGTQALAKAGGKSVCFPDMIHGWCSRGDLKDEKVKRDVEAPMALGIAFFAEHLSQPKL